MYTLAGLFGGVGGIELGFELAGFNVIWANEFDKNAAVTYQLNHSHELRVDDIHNVEPDDFPDVDILTGGFPCQAFSIAGYRKGFEDDRGNLFFEVLRLVEVKKPRVVFLENVKNLVGHDNGNTFRVIKGALEANGYKVRDKVMNGCEYGNVPQNRERIYIVAFLNEKDYEKFEFPSTIPLERKLRDVIDFESKVDDKFYYTPEKCKFYDELERNIVSSETIYQWRRQYVRENKSGVCPTLTANMGTGGHNVPLIYTKYGIRKLTPKECFNVQGFPLEFKLPANLAMSHLYKQAGNSVVVPVVRRIAENIMTALNANGNYEPPKHEDSEQLILQLI
ncbi:DNA cytosine methyltransferase [Rummeliibacillus pycnus]|uniref:DNA cytosine methyltransferase n=1 Tax=Rummeliibacillus pycnus TaxID=101070 RepID=UPI000C9B3EB3|nr:DNA cytosine methyltransferase [Rummeliibacillus pycnus]